MAPSLGAMLQVDLSSLHAGVVLVHSAAVLVSFASVAFSHRKYPPAYREQQYANKVVELQPQRSSTSSVWLALHSVDVHDN
jgi:hypothetical protein